ncbi:MAG: 3-oxosteroid 1-dehydrogenase [Halieaceae bacterium]|jgi:3-oxosteroid 1-dehydrogenase
MSDYDESFDFVIAGSGAGSMAAALYLHSAGKRVLILEKTELIGGTTARSGGVMWIPNNPFMARDGVADSYESAATYLDAVTGDQEDAPAATPERRRVFLNEAPQMLDFLLAQGIELDRPSSWPDYYDEAPGGSVPGRTVVAKLFNVNELGEWKNRLRPSFIKLPGDLPGSIEEMRQLPHMKRSWKSKRTLLKIIFRGIIAKLTGKHYLGGGAALQGRLLQQVLKAGVDVRTESPVNELILENGKVTGVVTRQNGRTLRVAAELGVLVNTGGFAHNAQMRERYQPGTSPAWSNAAPGDTGEMIKAMLSEGAAPAQIEEFVGYQATMPPGAENEEFKPGVQGLTAAPHAILVDRTGVRYMNEGGSYVAYCKGILERNKQVAAIPSWAIVDSQYMSKYMFVGHMPGSRLPQQWYDEGYLKKAASIIDLAKEIEVEPDALSATIERFNGFVLKGKDEDFKRGDRAYDNWLGDPLRESSQTLGTLEQGPFYAIPVVPGDVGTFGGVLTDEHSRVVRDDGSVIPGLYATGVATGSVMGRMYPGAGCSLGPAFTWAYVAAKHAAGT